MSHRSRCCEGVVCPPAGRSGVGSCGFADGRRRQMQWARRRPAVSLLSRRALRRSAVQRRPEASAAAACHWRASNLSTRGTNRLHSGNDRTIHRCRAIRMAACCCCDASQVLAECWMICRGCRRVRRACWGPDIRRIRTPFQPHVQAPRPVIDSGGFAAVQQGQQPRRRGQQRESPHAGTLLRCVLCRRYGSWLERQPA